MSQIISYDTYLQTHNMYQCPPRPVFHGAYLRKTVAGMVESLGCLTGNLNLIYHVKTHMATLSWS